MFDFSKEIIQSDADKILNDLSSDLIFNNNNFHTFTPISKYRKGDITLLNYKGLLCYLINNKNGVHIALSTRYQGLKVPQNFDVIGDLLNYTKNNIIKDILFLYNTYITDKNIYILNTFDTENEITTTVNSIIAQIIITLYKELKIIPIFLKNTNLIEFDTNSSINNVNDKLKTLYLDCTNLRSMLFDSTLTNIYNQFNKVINLCNSNINILLTSPHKQTTIYDKNGYLNYLHLSKFKGNIKGSGTIKEDGTYYKVFKNGMFNSHASYKDIIYNLTNTYINNFQMYKLLYNEDTLKNYTHINPVLPNVVEYYNIPYNKVKGDIMLYYNMLCDIHTSNY